MLQFYKQCYSHITHCGSACQLQSLSKQTANVVRMPAHKLHQGFLSTFKCTVAHSCDKLDAQIMKKRFIRLNPTSGSKHQRLAVHIKVSSFTEANLLTLNDGLPRIDMYSKQLL